MMVDLKIIIGGKNFIISCNPGEEIAAQESAKLLNEEAELLVNQLGRLPEDKMLLLSGLILGDKIRALKNEQSDLEKTLRATQVKLDQISLETDTDRSHLNILHEENSDDSLSGSGEKEAEKELQAVSEILDSLIEKITIPNSQKDLDNKPKLSSDSAQDSLL
jgi:cell division protein ZapA